MNKTILQMDVNEETKQVNVAIHVDPMELAEHLIGTMKKSPEFAAILCASVLIFEKSDPEVAKVLKAGKEELK